MFIRTIMEYEHERQPTAFEVNEVLCSGKQILMDKILCC